MVGKCLPKPMPKECAMNPKFPAGPYTLMKWLHDYKMMKTWIFKPATVMKYKELIPLAAMVTTAITCESLYTFYLSQTRVDLVYCPKTGRPLSETIDVINPKKYKAIWINQPYEPMPELDKLLKLMDEAEVKQETQKTQDV